MGQFYPRFELLVIVPHFDLSKKGQSFCHIRSQLEAADAKK